MKADAKSSCTYRDLLHIVHSWVPGNVFTFLHIVRVSFWGLAVNGFFEARTFHCLNRFAMVYKWLRHAAARLSFPKVETAVDMMSVKQTYCLFTFARSWFQNEVVASSFLGWCIAFQTENGHRHFYLNMMCRILLFTRLDSAPRALHKRLLAALWALSDTQCGVGNLQIRRLPAPRSAQKNLQRPMTTEKITTPQGCYGYSQHAVPISCTIFDEASLRFAKESLGTL